MSTVDWVLHVDLDQFIAAVEVARRPELRGLPVVVGGAGDPAQRAVVATASYEAREFGVRSGMPLRTAARLCPEAVFLPADKPAYQAVSDTVMATLRALPVVVEVLGWDEAFLGARTDDPERLAQEVRRAVAEETGLSCSVGIGDNKLRAKIATGFAKRPRRQGLSSRAGNHGDEPQGGGGRHSGAMATDDNAADRRVSPAQQTFALSAGSLKPAGIYRLTRDNWVAVMAERPTDALWGIGRKTARKLAEAGLTTVRPLATADPDMLAGRFGPNLGPWYRQLALGAGDAEVTGTPHVPRSRSRETTFQRNLTERADLERELVRLAEHVAEDVVTEGRPAVRVAVKVRFAPFLTQTHSRTLPAPTDDAAEITRAALELLDRFEHGRPVRLLGVRAEFG